MDALDKTVNEMEQDDLSFLTDKIVETRKDATKANNRFRTTVTKALAHRPIIRPIDR